MRNGTGVSFNPCRTPFKTEALASGRRRHLFEESQTRRAAQPGGVALQPQQDGRVAVHVAALADGNVVEEAVAEEAGLAAELVQYALLDDLVFALQSVSG